MDDQQAQLPSEDQADTNKTETTTTSNAEIPAKPKKQLSDWELARNFADQIGKPHRLFTNCIRYLNKISADTDNAQLASTQAIKYPLSLVIHSPSFKSIIYYAALAIKPHELNQLKAITPGTLISLYTPDELSSVISATYLYRRTRKRVDPQIWKNVVGEILIQMETGFHIGNSLPAIGCARGLLIGAIRYIALVLFSITDQRAFRLHTRHLNDHELLFDLKDEVLRWNCNHLQISASLLQAIGVGLGAASGLSATECPNQIDKSTKAKEILTWYAAREWIQTLLEKDCQPAEFNNNPKFSLDQNKIDKLKGKVEAIYKNGSSFNWIDKTKEDLPKALDEALKAPEELANNSNGETTEAEVDLLSEE